MSNKLFNLLMLIGLMAIYALLANWLIREWMASTCENDGRVRLNQSYYACESEDL